MAIKVYAPSTAGVLRQGEIIEALTQPRIDIDKLRAGELEVRRITHSLVIVLSQDCDLEQDFSRRAAGQAEDLLPSVLFCPAEDAETFRGATTLNSKEWKRVERNNEPRYHFLRAVQASEDAKGEGLPALAVDFKLYFALSTEESYYWLESAVRRCQLQSPYLEHLATRFVAYFSRIALPLDHHLPLPEEEAPAIAAAAPVALVDQIPIAAPPVEEQPPQPAEPVAPPVVEAVAVPPVEEAPPQ
jgi:hypothetical protein